MSRNFDLSRVNNAYAVVLGLGLVLEGVLAAWIAVASDGVERVAAGVIMAVILLVAISAAAYMQSRRPREFEQIKVDGIGSFRLPDQTEEAPPAGAPNAAASPAAGSGGSEERVGSSDGTFSIARPPGDWRIEEITFAVWVSRPLGITDPAAIENLTASLGPIGSTTVLAATSPRHVSIIPRPGLTRIEGRRFPTALELNIPFQIAVLPLEKASAPLFVEQPVLQHVTQILAGAAGGGMTQIRRFDTAVLAASKRPAVLAEMGQRISNAVVNGVEVDSVDIHWSLIGIEGPLRHYIIVMYYSFVSSQDNGVGLAGDLETLRKLAGSFAPLHTASPEAKQAEMAKLADENFEQLLAQSGDAIFGHEMTILRLRLQGMDLDAAADRAKAIQVLRPFKSLAEQVGLSDGERWTPLWESMESAERGDAVEFKQIVEELVDGLFPPGGDDEELDEPDGPLALGEWESGDADGAAGDETGDPGGAEPRPDA